MWGTLATFVVGILTVAVGAGLFLGWPARSRKALREEAALLEKLPPEFPGRSELEEYLAEGIKLYIERGRGEEMRRLDTTARWCVRVFIVLGLTVLLGLPLLVASNPDPSQVETWQWALGWGINILMFITLAVWQRTNVRRRRRRPGLTRRLQPRSS